MDKLEHDVVQALLRICCDQVYMESETVNMGEIKQRRATASANHGMGVVQAQILAKLLNLYTRVIKVQIIKTF